MILTVVTCPVMTFALTSLTWRMPIWPCLYRHGDGVSSWCQRDAEVALAIRRSGRDDRVVGAKNLHLAVGHGLWRAGIFRALDGAGRPGDDIAHERPLRPQMFQMWACLFPPRPIR